MLFCPPASFITPGVPQKRTHLFQNRTCFKKRKNNKRLSNRLMTRYRQPSGSFENRYSHKKISNNPFKLYTAYYKTKRDCVQFIVHTAPGYTCNIAKIAFQQSEALSAHRARFSPFNSGFSRKLREKNLAFQVGLNCNKYTQFLFKSGIRTYAQFPAFF